ncbi:MAG: hypothetical protein C4551_01920 [Bacillota bacterium]|jgi:hypothetical protein|nr:MAG: hypothetical protein C4551_01920 [Bacillota bacterium]
MVKATFWNDTELIRQFSRDQRLFYLGLIQLADDSGCLENDPWAFKIHLCPLEDDITIDILEHWTRRLINAGKAIPYSSRNKQCLFLANFAKHQPIKNPAPPEVPLPEWIEWVPYPSNHRTGHYEIDNENIPEPYTSLTPVLRAPDDVLPTEPNQEPNGMEPNHGACAPEVAPNGAEGAKKKPARKPKPAEGHAEDFEAFWAVYPLKKGKQEALLSYRRLIKAGADPAAIFSGAENYAAECQLTGREKRFIAHAKTFLNGRRYEDYQEPPDPADFAPQVRPRAGPRVSNAHAAIDEAVAKIERGESYFGN